MTPFKNKLNQVNEFAQNGDLNLAVRRLIDTVFDSNEKSFFVETLNLIEQHENSQNNDQLLENIKLILEKLSNFEIKTNISNDSLIHVEKINKKYAHGNFKLSELSFNLKPSEIIGLVGENGNGKTTLLRLLNQELKPDSGHIKFGLNHTNLYNLRSQLVYIPQRVPRWYGTLLDNLNFALSFHQKNNNDNPFWTELIIARLGLRPYKNLSWDRISSGYRTRFEIAKSLLRKPQILLLDEPLSNLDINSQQTILQDLKFLSDSLTSPFGIVLSSQQLYEVEKIADMIIFLKNGGPKYQEKNKNNLSEISELIFEIEANEEREILVNSFNPIGLNKIVFNGGVYMLYFNQETNPKDVFNMIYKNNLNIQYIRNISQSSRRFFIH